MSTNKYREDLNISVTYPLQRLSWKEKSKDDFKWVEKCADWYDYSTSLNIPRDYQEKMQINYDIYRGRGEDFMKELNVDFAHLLAEEGIEMNHEQVLYHPLIDQIAKAYVGEQQRRKLKPITIDASGYTMNFRKMERNKLFQDYINQTHILPMKEQVIRDVLNQLGTTDVFTLNPDEQEEFQFMVEERMESRTPDEIENYMRKDYKSPSETQGQRLMDFMMSELNLKYITDENFKHFIITGKQVYKIGHRHGMPYVEIVNPINFSNIASADSLFIEDSEAAKYDCYLQYSDFYNKFGNDLTKKDLEKIDRISGLSDGAWGISDYHTRDSKMVGEIAMADSVSGGQLFDNAPDVRTREGQEYVKNIYQKFGTSADNYSSILHSNIVYKSLRKLFFITRAGRDGGEETFFVDGDFYTPNKAKGDLEWKEIWAPQSWNVDKIGDSDNLYINKYPLPYQNLSADDPWNIKIPYVGIEYSKLAGNGKLTSPMDPAKPWQYKFNVQMAKIHETESTDIGKVLLTTMNAKPAEWSWGKWLMMMKYGKIAPINLTDEGASPLDANVFKSVDMGTLDRLAGQLQYLEFIKNQAALAMSYNPSRLGQAEPYVAVTNSQQSIVQSSYQTEDIFTTHNQVIENLLNALLRVARIAFKDNKVARTYLLDDMSIAELELDWQMLDRSKLGVKVRNSSDDYNNVMSVKNIAQSMVQNGLITFPELAKLMWASNGSDILNIAEQAEANAEKRRKQEFENQRQLMQENSQMQEQLQQIQRDFELLKQNNEIQKDLLVAEISATRDARQFDIDQDGMNDNTAREKMKIAHDAIQKQKDRDLEKLMHDDEIKVKNKQISVKSK